MNDTQAASKPIEFPKKPITLANLAKLNQYGQVTKVLKWIINSTELSDYDDELANRVRDAVTIIEGIEHLKNSGSIIDIELDEELNQKVEDHLINHRRIYAVKDIRDEHRLNLAQAKRYMEWKLQDMIDKGVKFKEGYEETE